MESVGTSLRPTAKAPAAALPPAAAAEPRDAFARSEPPPRLLDPRALRSATVLPPIPDARAIAADPRLRFEHLNQAITASYDDFAVLFQRIIDPGFSGAAIPPAPRPQSCGIDSPTWYGIAPFPSHTAGGDMWAAGALLRLLHRLPAHLPLSRALREVLPESEAPAGERLEAELACRFPGHEEREAAAFLVIWALAARRPHLTGAPILSTLGDPRTLAISADRLLHLAASAPGGSLRERLEAVAGTLRNALEDGNRRIFTDIGEAGQAYLEWRAGRSGPVAPGEVLDQFSLSDPPAPDQAREMYGFARRMVAAPGPLPVDYSRRFPADRYDLRNMLVAGFALYEKAGQTADARIRNRLVAMGNNFLAWREQLQAVQPAFTPPARPAGEVDREPLFQIITPFVGVPFRFGDWTYARYAADHLPARAGGAWMPRVTQYNWARFEDRWPGILDAFGEAYAHPAGMWPMPNPDPRQEI